MFTWEYCEIYTRVESNGGPPGEPRKINWNLVVYVKYWVNGESHNLSSKHLDTTSASKRLQAYTDQYVWDPPRQPSPGANDMLLLSCVAQFGEQGWEVYDIDRIGFSNKLQNNEYIYYLKRKHKQ